LGERRLGIGHDEFVKEFAISHVIRFLDYGRRPLKADKDFETLQMTERLL